MKVAMWLCSMSLVGLGSRLDMVPNYVVLILHNKCRDRHHIQGRPTWGLWEWFKEANGFDFE